MDQGMFELRHGGPTDRALVVMVRRTRDIDNQAQDTTDQMAQMRVIVETAERQTQEVVRDY